MSASLVGSEMCIRDRSRIASSPGLALAPARTCREAPRARLPACFVVTIGFSTQNDCEPRGRGLAGWKM
eukprot:3199788-Alexandrium_andersonii.AAC.1